ncbi:MAG: SGNH/GDSL hydrolase family protein [Clostridia bacterium]|nr:SGNH/GDSL hydrolase family protein [Clostridia bacterium]
MKVSLLGDSIRMIGYGTKVPELLGSDFEVFQPADNCRFSKYTLRVLANFRADMGGSRIVHWNNGLWDICNCTGDGFFTPEDEYVTNMTRIADILLSRHEKVIFATTTPTNKHPEFNGNHNIERYNALIVPILEKKGIIINDLYTPMSKDIDKYIRSDDHIHLTEAGIEVCAMQVADVIRKVAGELR